MIAAAGGPAQKAIRSLYLIVSVGIIGKAARQWTVRGYLFEDIHRAKR